ncbi:hypothetical protein CR513_34337, partial [Mucuna pruriens]
MMRLWITCYEQLVELFVISLVYVLHGLYILSSSVGGDLSWKNFEVKEEMPKEESETHHDLPPIVLVHGYFGFGSFAKGVSQTMGALSHFAEAVHKEQRVLAPDLGSLTSIYDR